MVVPMTNKPCMECNRFWNEHSHDEILECAMNIIKGVTEKK